MWIVQIKDKFQIAGCPDNGIPAIDLRKAYGIPAEPDCTIRLEVDCISEGLVRRFPELSDSNADIRWGKDRYNARLDSLRNVSGYVVLPPELVSSLGTLGSGGGVDDAVIAALLTELIRLNDSVAQQVAEKEVAYERERAERDERRMQKAREEAEAEQAKVSDQLRALYAGSHLTLEEIELFRRERLDPESVIKRLQEAMKIELLTQLDDPAVSSPDGFDGEMSVEVGHRKAKGWGEVEHRYWTPDMLRTAKAIEDILGRPVDSIVTYGEEVDPMAFNTYATAPWEIDELTQLAISVHFAAPDED